MIPGDLLSAFPYTQFHTLPSLLDSWAALPNSYPNALRAMQEGSLYHFYDGLWYDRAERRTHDLPCEKRTRYRLSQPDTVNLMAEQTDSMERQEPNNGLTLAAQRECNQRCWVDKKPFPVFMIVFVSQRFATTRVIRVTRL